MANDAPLIPYDKIANYLIPIGLFSAFVAWSRNQGTNIILRLFFVVMAYLFNVFYLLYIVYKWIFA
jgi:hypothetical protein